ncbi:MAG: endonuclease [Candidatus Bathyarchaeota archaeon]|nr:MAG: endonuclease [Candidatus Bathyarchaeota archaeon]
MSLRDLADTKPKRERFTRQLDRKQVRRMKKRGYDAERELVKKLRDAGFDALRVPVSAPSNEPLPDVFAVKDKTILACEVKSQQRYAYFKSNQVSKLHEFLQIHRIYPKRLAVLAAKFKYKGWVFEVASKTDDYSLRIGQGMSFRDLLKVAE